jgi:prophage regulatory protein
MQPHAHAPKLLKLPEVRAITKLSRSAIYAGIRNRTFPAPLHTSVRSVAWLEADIHRWVASLLQKRDQEAS